MLDNVFLVCAVLGGTVMVCQFLLTLLGMGDDGGDMAGDAGDFSGDADVGGGDFDGGDFDGGDHHSTISQASDAEFQHHGSSWLFGVLSFRTLVAALAFFGISGKAALAAQMAQPVSLILATSVGLAAMYGMYWLMLSISRLNSSGNEHIGNALGKPATVYVSIPASRKGAGKVQLSMQNRIVEYQAVTAEEEPLKSGEPVEVVEILNRDTVQVRRTENSC